MKGIGALEGWALSYLSAGLSQQSTLIVVVNGNLNGNLNGNQNRRLNENLDGTLKGNLDSNPIGNLDGTCM